MDPQEIRKRFLANADVKYKEFSDKIVVPGEHGVAGIRMPVIKEFAKEISRGDWKRYLSETKDEYSEDLILRGLIISIVKTDIDEKLRMISEFVPLIDNWAVCDSFCLSLKMTKKNMDAVWNMILGFINKNDEFQIRFAIVMMLGFFIDEKHVKDVISHMEEIKHPGYYVKMAVAWCLSVCFIKFPDETMRYLKNNTLDDFTFNKALSKITDSFRVDPETKEKIRVMRRR